MGECAMTAPAPIAPRHGDQCRCPQCLTQRKQQYHAYMDRAPAWTTRTTRPEEFDPLLDLSVRLMAPARALKARNVELLEQVAKLEGRVAQLECQQAVLGYFNTALNKANEAGEPRGLELDGEVWVVKPGDNANEHWRKWLETQS